MYIINLKLYHHSLKLGNLILPLMGGEFELGMTTPWLSFPVQIPHPSMGGSNSLTSKKNIKMILYWLNAFITE